MQHEHLTSKARSLSFAKLLSVGVPPRGPFSVIFAPLIQNQEVGGG